MNATRSWIAVHEAKSPVVILLVSAVAGAFISSSGISNLGMMTLPETVPYWLLLPTLWGILAANLLNYRGPAHVVTGLGRPGFLVRTRGVWLGAVFGLAACCCVVVWLAGSDVNLAVMLTNLALFTGLTLAAVLAGFPHVSWLVSAALTVAAMGFGFPQGSADGVWYPWASFLSEYLTPGRLAVSWGIFGATSSYYLARGGRAGRGGGMG